MPDLVVQIMVLYILVSLAWGEVVVCMKCLANIWHGHHVLHLGWLNTEHSIRNQCVLAKSVTEHPFRHLWLCPALHRISVRRQITWRSALKSALDGQR